MDVKEVLTKYVQVDMKGLAIDWLMDEVLKSKLDEIVKDSSNPYDDMLLSYVYPMLRDAASKAVEGLEAKSGI